MNLKTILILFQLLVVNAGLFSQQAMSWEDCVEFALENSLSLQEEDLLLHKQKLIVNGAYHSYLPRVGGSANFNQNYGRYVDPNTNAISNNDSYNVGYGFNSSIDLFNGFIRNNQLKYEKYIYEYSKDNLDAREKMVAFSVLDLYFKALFYAGIKEIAREQVDVSNQQLRKQNKMLELGLTSAGDISDYEAELAQDSLNLIQYDVEWLTAINDLKREMNFPIADTLLLVELENAPKSESVSELTFVSIMAHAESNLPEVRMLENDLKAASKSLAMAKGRVLPTLSADAYWRSAYYENTTDDNGNTLGFADQRERNMRKGFGFSLYIPIFRGLSNYINIQRSKVDYEIAKTRYESEWVRIQYKVYEDVILLESAVKKYQASVENEEKQQIAFESGEKKLDKGMISIIDYRTLKNDYAESKARRLQSGLELFIQYKTIQYYLTGEVL